jgi:hypothetical protein
VLPSSSVCDFSLQPVEKVTESVISSEANVRPVWESVNRIGSSSTWLVGASRFAQVSRAGEQLSSKVVNRVCTSDWLVTAPVFQLTPTEGSPRPGTSVVGKTWKRATGPAGGTGSAGIASRKILTVLISVPAPVNGTMRTR